MAYDDKNKGALFKNENKQKDNHPDYRGPFTDANGVEMEMAAWIRQSKAGKTYMSVMVSEKREPVKRDEPPAAEPLDDSIPF